MTCFNEVIFKLNQIYSLNGFILLYEKKETFCLTKHTRKNIATIQLPLALNYSIPKDILMAQQGRKDEIMLKTSNTLVEEILIICLTRCMTLTSLSLLLFKDFNEISLAHIKIRRQYFLTSQSRKEEFMSLVHFTHQRKNAFLGSRVNYGCFKCTISHVLEIICLDF